MPDFPHSRFSPDPQVDAVVARFWRFGPTARGGMVVEALGGVRKPEGWLLPNRRVVTDQLAAYYATDLTTIAAAERALGIAVRRTASQPRTGQAASLSEGLAAVSYTVAFRGTAWVGRVLQHEPPLRVRVRTARETDTRALLVVLLALARRTRRDCITVEAPEPASTVQPAAR